MSYLNSIIPSIRDVENIVRVEAEITGHVKASGIDSIHTEFEQKFAFVVEYFNAVHGGIADEDAVRRIYGEGSGCGEFVVPGAT